MLSFYQLHAVFWYALTTCELRRLSKDFDASSSSVVSSKRLLDLGFMFEYGIGDIVKESVAQCVQHGFLECPDDGRHDLE